MLLLAGRAAADTLVVRGVQVEGNERTDSGFVARALGVAPGEPFDPALVPVVEQRVMNLRLFREVHVEPVPDGAGGVILHVTVKERRTFVPVPVAGASRGVVGGGIFLLDSNLFGRGEQLAGGVFVSNRGTSVNLGYRDPGVAGTPLLLTAEVARVDMMREQDAGLDTLYQFQDRRWDYGATVGWRVAEGLTVRGGWFGLIVDATPIAGFAPPPRVGPVRGLSGEIAYDGEDFHLWHVTGFSTRVRYRQGVSWLATSRDLYQLSARATWSTRALADHALSLSAGLDGSHGDPVVDALRLGGLPGSRGFIRGGLWAETAGTATAEYQIPLRRLSWGVVTWAAFCDAGGVRWRGADTFYAAPGLGVRLYLRNVAIPVIGLDVAQATGVGAPVVSFAAGWRT